MTAIRAHIENGAVVLDEPLDLPNGTQVIVTVSGAGEAFADMSVEERTELEEAIEEGHADFEKGDVIDGIDFAKGLLART